MAQIESLTPEQEAQIPAYYERWLKTGLSIDPADHKLAEAAMADVYKSQGFKPPKVTLWADSPIAGARLAALLARPKNAIKNPGADRIREMVTIGPDNAEPTRAEINDQLQWGKLGFGQQDAHWLGYYDFFKNEVGVEGLEKAQPLIDLAQNCNWWWSFQYAAILTEKPTRLEVDDQGRLHSHTGMAIQFKDDFGMYAHRGLTVTEQLILHPETLTAEQVFAEGNAEIRRAMIERMGNERFIALANPTILDTDTDELGFDRRLLQIELRGDEPLTVVEMINSTPEIGLFNDDGSPYHKHYYVRVHSELRPMLDDGTYGDPQKPTALNALASTHGLRGEEYQLVAQS